MVYHKKQEGWRREEPDAHGEVSNVHLFLLESDNVCDNPTRKTDILKNWPHAECLGSSLCYLAIIALSVTG